MQLHMLAHTGKHAVTYAYSQARSQISMHTHSKEIEGRKLGRKKQKINKNKKPK